MLRQQIVNNLRLLARANALNFRFNMTDSFHLADPAAARRYLNNFAYGTRQRGEHYYQDGTVQDLSVGEDGARVAAEVQGSHLYVTSLVYNGAVWKSECSCPMEADCKHAYAVMKTALSRQVVSTAKTKGKAAPISKPAAAQP